MTTVIYLTKPAVQSFIGAADTQTSVGGSIVRGPDHRSKIFSPPGASHLVFGLAGDVSIRTALMSLKVPAKPKPKKVVEFDDMNASAYIEGVVVPAIKAHLNAHFKDDSPFVFGPYFGLLIWIKDTDHVYEVSGDFAVTQNKTGFYAVGSGSPHAEASFRMRPEAGILDHLKYAAEHDLYTSGPFHVLETEGGSSV